MDRFPEAFKRFEEVVDVSKIKSFQQLLMAFKLWAGRKWKDSPLQIEALKEEAFKREIPQIPVTHEEYLRKKAEIDKLYERVYYCRRRYEYNEAVWKALTAELGVFEVLSLKSELKRLKGVWSFGVKNGSRLMHV